MDKNYITNGRCILPRTYKVSYSNLIKAGLDTLSAKSRNYLNDLKRKRPDKDGMIYLDSMQASRIKRLELNIPLEPYHK